MIAKAGADAAGTAPEAADVIGAGRRANSYLPSMDDDLRRGQPTVHTQFDEATAVLAGNALNTMDFELLTEPLSTKSLPSCVVD